EPTTTSPGGAAPGGGGACARDATTPIASTAMTMNGRKVRTDIGISFWRDEAYISSDGPPKGGPHVRAPSRWKSDRQLDGAVLVAHAPIGGADHERRLDPGARAYVLRQISRAHHHEQGDQRRLTFLEHHRTTADDDEVGGVRRALDPIPLLFGKH